MGLLDKILGKKEPERKVQEYFKMLDGYSPVFRTFEGSVYEMDLTRSVIHSFATHCSKLNMEVQGSANETLKKRLRTKANPYIDTAKYLYRIATIYQVNNNVVIIPVVDEVSKKITGFYPILPESVEMVEYRKQLYLIYTLQGKRRAIEYEKAGIINQFQYEDDFWGNSNCTMQPTLKLLDTQNQGIIEGIRSGAKIRFLAKLANVLNPEDIKEEQKRFSDLNLSEDNGTGVAIFDSKYEDVKQIVSKPYIVNSEEMKDIKDSVYTHFGTNEEILQNRFNSSSWSAYYEGLIEPFAIKASLVHTNLVFSDREQSSGNNIMLTANRLQYLSNQEKLQTVTQLFDRGFLTHNQGLEIFNMSPIEEGDKRYIRKEYSEAMKLDSPDETENYSEVEDDTAE